MRVRWTVGVLVALGSVALVSAAPGEVFVYPKKGQGQQQFEQDQYQCHQWAKGQTGVDPAAPASAAAAPPPARGGAVRGGARGAAVGAIGGAIGGNAGKGAAIGAGVGAATGAMRQGAQNRQAAASAQQTNLDRYERAYAACLEGRGYQVR